MGYKKMIEDARRSGVTSEKAMWESIADIDDLLEVLETDQPDIVKKFYRKQHERLYGPHYNEIMAVEAVRGIRYTDREGKMREGAYWTVEEIEEATRTYAFPPDVTKWDKYVAFNVFRSDVCKKLDDANALAAGYAFFFADEDFHGGGKIWRYMGCIRE